jgi:hypothetical protein
LGLKIGSNWVDIEQWKHRVFILKSIRLFKMGDLETFDLANEALNPLYNIKNNKNSRSMDNTIKTTNGVKLQYWNTKIVIINSLIYPITFRDIRFTWSS